MAILELNASDGLFDRAIRVILRTEHISAIWIDDPGGTAVQVMVLFNSGELQPLFVKTLADAQSLATKIMGAM